MGPELQKTLVDKLAAAMDQHLGLPAPAASAEAAKPDATAPKK